MRYFSQLNFSVIIRSAILFFAVPFVAVLSILSLFGLFQLVITRKPQNVMIRLRVTGESDGFAWLSHGIHTLSSSIIGYYLARKLGRAAIPNIWIALFLALSVHMGIHVLSGISLRILHTRFRYVRLPFMMLIGAFAGFHTYFVRQFRMLNV